MLSFLLSILSIFFDYFILNISRFVFFICLGLIGLFVAYRIYEKYEKAAVKNEVIKFFIQRTGIAFYIFLTIYLIFSMRNEFYEIPFINLNYVLIAVIGLGALSFLFPYETEGKIKKVFDNIMIYVLAISGIGLIFLKTKEIGWLSYAITGVLLFSLIVLFDNFLYKEEGIKDIN